MRSDIAGPIRPRPGSASADASRDEWRTQALYPSKAPKVPRRDDTVNIIAEKNIATNTEKNYRQVSSWLQSLGLRVGVRFARCAEVHRIGRFTEARLNILASDGGAVASGLREVPLQLFYRTVHGGDIFARQRPSFVQNRRYGHAPDDDNRPDDAEPGIRDLHEPTRL